MDLTAQRERLHRDLAETERTLGVIRERLQIPQAESTGELSMAGQHPADVATETESRELDMTRERMLDARRARIRDAIARMEAGTYGRCVVCGGQIPDERLEVLPETPWCVKDAAKEERK
jgi:RNA polymerase-binding transcription factor DksA